MSPIGGFHVTSSPPCWWTVNKKLLISSFCLSTTIVHFTIVICVSRDCMKTTYCWSNFVFSVVWAKTWHFQRVIWKTYPWVKESPMFHIHDPFNGTKKQPNAARVQFYLWLPPFPNSWNIKEALCWEKFQPATWPWNSDIGQQKWRQTTQRYRKIPKISPFMYKPLQI